MTDEPKSVDPIRPAAAGQPTWAESKSQLDAYAERLRVMLPAAPPGLLEGYMRWAPWVAIVFGILALVVIVFFSILGSVVGSLAIVFGVVPLTAAPSALLAGLVSLIGAALEVAGGYLMLKRRETGWWLLAIGIVLALLGNLVRISVISLAIWLVIGYIHLQVKPNYH